MRAWRLSLVAAGMAALMPAGLRAEEIRGYVEFTAEKGRNENEDVNGQRLTQVIRSFLQRYNLDVQTRPYPNLVVDLGGLFERTDETVDEQATSTEAMRRRVRPYLTATLRNVIFNAAFGYYRTRDDVSAQGASQGLIQETWNATAGWRPESAPEVRMRFIRTNNLDAAREFIDTTDDLADITAEYQAHESLHLYYRGAVESLDDHLQDLTVRTTTHAGRVNYGDAFFDRRLEVSGEYDANHSQREITSAGVGEITTVLFPLQGLSIVSDTPDAISLAPNGALIDGDRVASAGLNLGLQPLGGDERPRNIGLDFGGPTAVNTIDVWVDRDLPQTITDSFAWSVWTSADNLNWTFQQIIAPATFGPFDRRFEIRFPNLTARYVKVTTPSLGRNVPSASSYPNILVTECTAALRTPVADVQSSTSLSYQLVTTNVRARITRDPLLYYEMSYFLRQTGSLPSIYTLSNGLSLTKTFNPIYSVAGRVAREDSRESEGDRATSIYTASLRAVPLPTLQSSAIFSGRSSSIEGRNSDANSFYLNTSADVYRGITATLGLGWSGSTGENGEGTDTRRINALATLLPHPTTTVNLIYQVTDGTRRSGSGQPLEPVDTSATQASVAYRPFAALYFFTSYRMETSSQAANRFLRAYSFSWTPFPDGTLQVQFSYDESYQSELDALTRILSPRVRWNITNRWYAELTYEKSEFTSGADIRHADTLTATTRIWF